MVLRRVAGAPATRPGRPPAGKPRRPRGGGASVCSALLGGTLSVSDTKRSEECARWIGPDEIVGLPVWSAYCVDNVPTEEAFQAEAIRWPVAVLRMIYRHDGGENLLLRHRKSGETPLD